MDESIKTAVSKEVICQTNDQTNDQTNIQTNNQPTGKANAKATQTQFRLYDCALHPEFFELYGRRSIKHPMGTYQMEAWLFHGGHAIRFEYGTLCATELVVDAGLTVPKNGVVASQVVLGEYEREHLFRGFDVQHLCSLQIDLLTPGVYMSDRHDMSKYLSAGEGNLVCEWETPDGIDLSGLRFEKRANEIHIEAFHYRAQGCRVVQTLSIFEHAV